MTNAAAKERSLLFLAAAFVFLTAILAAPATEATRTLPALAEPAQEPQRATLEVLEDAIPDPHRNAEKRLRLFEDLSWPTHPLELVQISKTASGVFDLGLDCNVLEKGGLSQDCDSPSFQGLWHDPTTGLAYARNRWYDARTASWLSEDPLGPVDSPNLYAFVAWGPHMGRDPMGEGVLEDISSGLHKGYRATASALHSVGNALRGTGRVTSDAVYVGGQFTLGMSKSIVYGSWDSSLGVLQLTPYTGLRAQLWASRQGFGLRDQLRIALDAQLNADTLGFYGAEDKGAHAERLFGIADQREGATEMGLGIGEGDSDRAWLGFAQWCGGVGNSAGWLAGGLETGSGLYGVARARLAGTSGFRLFDGHKSAPVDWDAPGGGTTSLDPLPDGVEPYQLRLFADEPYDRVGHYGNTPTAAQRASVPPGMEFDHNPMLVEHYFDGPGEGRLPGFNLTDAERKAFAVDLDSGCAATPTQQRAQGARAAAYSKRMKKIHGLN
jgi:RHS repeat-associated protein